MKTVQRTAAIVTLLAFMVINPAVFYAQEDDTIGVAGSGIVIDVLTAVNTAADTGLTLDVDVTGTTAGFSALCNGEADLTGAVRPISVDEESVCVENGIDYTEFLIGYNIMTLITHPDSPFGECFSTPDLNSIFAPSAEGVTSWEVTGIEGAEDEQLVLLLPADDTPLYALLDRAVDGIGLRRDVQIMGEDGIIETASTTPSSVGVVSLSAAIEAGDAIRIINLQNEVGECVSPSVETVEDRQYTTFDRLLVYAAGTELQNTSSGVLLSLFSDEANASFITDTGYTPPTGAVFETNQLVLELGEGGRQFSVGEASFEIPESLFGAVQIAGAAGAFSYFENVTTLFTTQYPGTSISVDLRGEPEGQRRFCNGEIDMLAAYGELSDDQAENCAANNISAETFELGVRAVVLVANESDDFATCLASEEISELWRADSEDPVSSWDQVSTDYPNTPIILVAPGAESQGYTDLLMTTVRGAVEPRRIDVAETRNDPLYRAAAVANVSGGLTYMSWQEYQRVNQNGQEGIMLVEVDAGQGCVLPSPETIASGDYPLTQPFHLIVSQSAMARSEVQSLLWFIFSDEFYDLFETHSIIGPTFGNLPAFRESLQSSFSEAIAIGIDPVDESEMSEDAEADPEITPEVTPES